MSPKPVLLNAKEAMSHVHSGMTVAFSHLSAEPTALTDALWSRAEDLSDLTVYSGMLLSGYGFLKSPAARNIRFKTWFLPGTLLRKTAPDVEADYLPMTWSQTVRFLWQANFDVALIQISPADENGFHSLGLNATISRALIARARLVIAQVNSEVPYTLGDSRVHQSEIDILVEKSEPLIAYPARPIEEIDQIIGDQIADLVQDGVTLSFGVGGIPSATAEALIRKGRRDILVINTFTDSVRQMIEGGCCRQELPKAYAGDIFGTPELYKWVHRNENVELIDTRETHTVEAMVARGGVTSVNSALEVDLFGQVNSETLGGKQAGGMGGSVDFAVGGQVAGGNFILGLRSRTNSGAPRIVGRLEGDIVSLSRTFVETVVTEYGVADLRNKTVHERAVALANVAHPEDRAALLKVAATLR